MSKKGKRYNDKKKLIIFTLLNIFNEKGTTWSFPPLAKNDKLPSSQGCF
jgi:hypothetical protein